MKTFDLMRPKKEYDGVIAQREIDGKNFYKKYQKNLVETTCPACDSEGSFAFSKFGFSHKICPRCKTLFCSPRPSDDLLATYYSEYDAPQLWTKLLLKADHERKVVQYTPRVKRIVDCLKGLTIRPGLNVLDAGAGSGAFAVCLKNSGFFREVTTLDISDSCVRACKEQGLIALKGTLADIPSGSFDLITLNDLIEHVYSPRKLLEQCHSVLRENGVIAIATPNGEGFDFKILREKAGNITPPEHLNYFNPESLTLLYKSAGFLPVHIETPGLLDVDMVNNARSEGFPLEKRNEYLGFILDQGDEIREEFQKFISRCRLSSHMVIIAQKQR